MRFSILMNCLLAIFIMSLLHKLVFAIPKSYIVYLGSHHGEPRLLLDSESVTKSHLDLLSHVVQSDLEPTNKLIYSYNKVFNGFAAILEEGEANELKKNPDVVSIFESQLVNLQTTRSWEFLEIGKEQKHSVHAATRSLWGKTRFGEDLIAAAIDSGVWPESKSFIDDGFGPIPKRFKGHCANENDKTFRCNRKLIGARYFHKGCVQAMQEQNKTFNHNLSPRDMVGHGTHVLSTIGGNFVRGANYFGFANGTAKGGAPRARLVSYKVCWERDSCTDIDILAGFEAAIHDGVDIINLSLGTMPRPYFTDSISIGCFYAMKHGILVVAAAGNSGPTLGTVANVAPWVLTVAASTMDRMFVNNCILGNKKFIQGASFSNNIHSNKFYPLVSDSDVYKVGSHGILDPFKVKGKIIVFRLNGDPEPLKIAYDALKIGAVGIILANDAVLGSTIIPWIDPIGPVQISHITHSDSKVVFNYMKSTRSPIASLTKATTKLRTKPAPIMATFSSRGPNMLTDNILKPDVTAPGVHILAAVNESFVLMEGTSMASPHVTAIAGLLKTLHPSWSTAAIRSAIMTTASPMDNTRKMMRDRSLKEATPFHYGAGHVRPNLAMDPGLVYDMDHHDYLRFLCTQHDFNKTSALKFTKHAYNCPKAHENGNFNYPSITIFDFKGNVTIARKLKNVGSPGTYIARVEAPRGVSIIVEPHIMRFSAKGQVMGYKLIFSANVNHLPIDYVFGSLVWSDGKHIVRSPIVMIPKDKLLRDGQILLDVLKKTS